MTCQCVQCDECNGSGSIWRSFSGKYLGRNHCDDLDDLETCEECQGSGITRVCDECQEFELEQEAAEHQAPADGAPAKYIYCECPSCHATGLPELFIRRR